MHQWAVLGVGVENQAVAGFKVEKLVAMAVFDRSFQHVEQFYPDQIEAFKDAILINVLLPVKRLLLALSWLGFWRW